MKGWLIERSVNGRALWWCPGQCTIPGLTTDASKAVRFARKEDAELVRKELMGDEAYVTEHVWQEGTLTPAEPVARESAEKLLLHMVDKFVFSAANGYCKPQTAIDAIMKYALQLLAPQPVDLRVPSLLTLLDIIFANDGGTIEHEGPVPMRIAKAILAHLTAQATPEVVGSV